MKVLIATVGMIIALSLAACGSDEDRETNPVTGATVSATAPNAPTEAEDVPTAMPEAVVDEDELAKSLLLTVDDFPVGWREVAASDSDEESPLDRCLFEHGEEVGRAESGDFDDGDWEISNRVVIFADTVTPQPEDFLASLQCAVDAFNDGEADFDDIEYMDASVGTMSFPPHGDGQYAYRIEVRAKQKGASGFGSEASIYIDMVAVFDGRLTTQVMGLSLFSPVDAAFMVDLVGKATAKLEAAEQ